MALNGGIADPGGSRSGLAGAIAQALETLLGGNFDSEFSGRTLEAISGAICDYLESSGVGSWQFHTSYQAVGGEVAVALGISDADTTAGSNQVFRSGLLMLGSGNDYTMTSSTVTFVVPLGAGELVQVFARRTT